MGRKAEVRRPNVEVRRAVIQHPVSTMSSILGCSLDDLDTPALVLDLTVLDRNLEKMASFFRGRACQLRPHFKNHKCTRLARRQLDAGAAVGMTCAKLGEAEVLVDAGFDDILIANQVVGSRKMARLVAIADRAAVCVAVDHPSHLESISQAGQAAGVTIGVLVEVDIGMHRCGVPPGEPALDLARLAADLPGIRFDGLQAFEGHLPYVEDRAERRKQTATSMQLALDTRRLIEDSGLPVAVVSGGSSSTYDITGALDGVDELQAGTYATMDCAYRRRVPEFEIAMTIAARVISRPQPDVAVLDVGIKGGAHEFGVPEVKDYPQATVPFFMSEEHCLVHNVPDWPIGQVVELISSHACTTCNLYREFHVVDQGKVVDVWPIEAAGKLA